MLIQFECFLISLFFFSPNVDIESTFVDDGAMKVTLTAAISETKFLAVFGDGTLMIYDLEKPTCIEIDTRDTGR